MLPLLNGYAQTLYKGRVVDNKNEPIVGATIISLEDKNNGVATDFEGNFSIKSITNKIEISVIGYQMKTVILDKNFNIIVIKENQPTGLFNVSSGEAHSIKEIFDIVSQYLSLPIAEVPIEPVGADDVPIVSLDASETSKMFGWKAKVEFKEIINNQLKWYEKYGITDVFSHLKTPNKKD